MRLRGSKIQQIVKSLSVREEMGCSKKRMNFLFYVMLKLLSSFSQAVAASMSMLTTGKTKTLLLHLFHFHYLLFFNCFVQIKCFFLPKAVTDLGFGSFLSRVFRKGQDFGNLGCIENIVNLFGRFELYEIKIYQIFFIFFLLLLP